MTNIGILALQGAFAEHEAMLRRLGVSTFQIRRLADWQQPMDGLVIPGGESTTQLKLLRELELLQPVSQAIDGGLPVFGTCAGLILLARQEDGKPRQGLATMDIDVCRNAYGRQLGSFSTTATVRDIGDDVPLTFIRAPYIRRTLSPDVEVLAEVGGHIVAARQGSQLVTAFHPELTADERVHRYFLQLVAAAGLRSCAPCTAE